MGGITPMPLDLGCMALPMMDLLPEFIAPGPPIEESDREPEPIPLDIGDKLNEVRVEPIAEPSRDPNARLEVPPIR